MNEFFCSKCLKSLYSAMSTISKCANCGGKVIINPEKEVKAHLKKFRDVTKVVQPKEE